METKKIELTGFLTRRELPGETQYHLSGENQSVLIREITTNPEYKEMFVPGAKMTITVELTHNPDAALVPPKH